MAQASSVTEQVDSDTPAIISSLADLCVASAASGHIWSKQWRALHRLPEHAANHLLQLLLENGQLSRAYQLELFSHCASEVHIHPGLTQAEYVDKGWLSYLAHFKHLTRLTLDTCPRLSDTALSAMWPGLTSLTRLSLARCTSAGNAALNGMQQLTQLTYLDLTDTVAFDDESAGQAMALPALHTLVAWGTAVSSTGLQLLGFCEGLVKLDVSWTAVDMLPALTQLTSLEMQHCQLRGVWWPFGDDGSGGGVNSGVGRLSLHTLSLANTPVSQEAAGDVRRCLAQAAHTLVHVDIRGTRHVSTQLGWLQAATALQRLWLDAPTPAVSAATLTHISHATALQSLSIRGIQMTQADDLLWLLPLAHITNLELSHCHLTDSALPTLATLTNLHTLNLDGSHMTGTHTHTQDTHTPHTLSPQPSVASEPIDLWRAPPPEPAPTHTNTAHTDSTTANGSGQGPNNGQVAETETVESYWGQLVGLRELSLLESDLCDEGLCEIVCAARGLSVLVCGGQGVSDAGLRGVGKMGCGVGLRVMELRGCDKITMVGVGLLRHLPSLQSLTVTHCKQVHPTEALSQRLLSSHTLTQLTIDTTRYVRHTPTHDTQWTVTHLTQTTPARKTKGSHTRNSGRQQDVKTATSYHAARHMSGLHMSATYGQIGGSAKTPSSVVSVSHTQSHTQRRYSGGQHVPSMQGMGVNRDAPWRKGVEGGAGGVVGSPGTASAQPVGSWPPATVAGRGGVRAPAAASATRASVARSAARASAVPLVHDASDTRYRYTSAQMLTLQDSGVGTAQMGTHMQALPWMQVARELNLLVLH